MPRIFRRQAKSPQRVVKPKELSPREKGYDARWDRYSARLRKSRPFCVHCLESDRLTLTVSRNTGVVDHKRPISEGGDMWEPSNHQVLCGSCHSGWKARLEEHARATGQMDKIIAWCDDPLSRPKLRGDI